MGKFLNALMNKQVQQPSNINPATTGQPVPTASITTPPSKLTSDAALNQAAVGAWPAMLDGGAKFWNGGWRQSVLREVSNHNVAGNYGSVTSMARFGFRWRKYVGVGSYPGPVPNAYRPTWQELIPIVWGLRVANPNVTPTMVEPQGNPVIQTKPTTWQGANTASLNKTGVVLL